MEVEDKQKEGVQKWVLISQLPHGSRIASIWQRGGRVLVGRWLDKKSTFEYVRFEFPIRHPSSETFWVSETRIWG